MKILFSCRALNDMAGGVERMIAVLMDEMIARGHEAYLITWDKAGASPFYPLNPKIKWMQLDSGDHLQKAGWVLRVRRALKIRAFVKNVQPDIVLAFQHGTFLGLRVFLSGMDIPVVAAERNAPARFDHLKAGRYRGFIYQSFRLAKKITVQCESYRNDYPAYLRKKIVTISNPVFPAQCQARPDAGSDRKILLTVGRLSYQKNYEALVKSFAHIASAFPDWTLVMAGEGEDRDKLEALVKELGIESRIQMKGAVRDVASLYCESHLFCLPSRWEGFPNALAEAMAHGLPCVGFAACAGVRDLIQEGENGLLAAGNGDSKSLAMALRLLMADPSARAAMGEKAKLSMNQYNPLHIFDRWEKFLKDTAST